MSPNLIIYYTRSNLLNYLFFIELSVHFLYYSPFQVLVISIRRDRDRKRVSIRNNFEIDSLFVCLFFLRLLT